MVVGASAPASLMPFYQLSPYATFVDSHLAGPQFAVFHRLTGELVETTESVRSLLLVIKQGRKLSFVPEDAARSGDAGRQVRSMVELKLLVEAGADHLASLTDHLVVRPLQNPALTFRADNGRVLLVRMSMAELVYSRAPNQRPQIFEEELAGAATKLLLAADGTRTLQALYAELRPDGPGVDNDQEFRAVIDFLTEFERQLIKFAPANADLNHPFLPFNTVPRNLYHAEKWGARDDASKENDIKAFHREGIDDAAWEFDVLEPTVNHALRFPSKVLGGQDYGARFCAAVMSELKCQPEEISVLEVGGGTGTFAKSFINEAQVSTKLKYHILELSPTLLAAQQRTLSDADISVEHFQQDATEFNLGDRQFELIIANEVIADFAVAPVEKKAGPNGLQLDGEGASDVQKYQLPVKDAANRFLLNSGVFRFMERAWLHLRPGGILVMSEYGEESAYPAESFHLNHAEYSIHFGHVAECARRIGFEPTLKKLTEFLAIDDNVSVLNGREEHLMCLGHLLAKQEEELPFALFSEADFMTRYGEVTDHLGIDPIRFLPLSRNFYYGADIAQFFVIVLRKPLV
jgi:protein-L-isoaspartate O-methyltransferase